MWACLISVSSASLVGSLGKVASYAIGKFDESGRSRLALSVLESYTKDLTELVMSRPKIPVDRTGANYAIEVTIEMLEELQAFYRTRIEMRKMKESSLNASFRLSQIEEAFETDMISYVGGVIPDWKRHRPAFLSAQDNFDRSYFRLQNFAESIDLDLSLFQTGPLDQTFANSYLLPQRLHHLVETLKIHHEHFTRLKDSIRNLEHQVSVWNERKKFALIQLEKLSDRTLKQRKINPGYIDPDCGRVIKNMFEIKTSLAAVQVQYQETFQNYEEALDGFFIQGRILSEAILARYSGDFDKQVAEEMPEGSFV